MPQSDTRSTARSAGVFAATEGAEHERVLFCHDPKSGTKAIIALHSTTLGNALGGVRRWHYATEADALRDVLRLSEAMTYKAAVAGLQMSGGKSVILLERPDQKPTRAEAQAMGRFVESLGGAYIAAEDVGVNTDFVDAMALETRHVMGGETMSVGGDPSAHATRGVVGGMRACLKHLGSGDSLRGIKVAVQGLGNVGFKVAAAVIAEGGELVASDIHPTRINRAVKALGVRVTSPEGIVHTPCDILAPCALGGVVNAANVRSLECRIVCGSANNALEEPETDAQNLKTAGILYAPDFVVNAGGLIHLAGLYLGFSEKDLQRKIDAIESTTQRILQVSEGESSTYAAALEVARQRIADKTIETRARPTSPTQLRTSTATS